MFICYKVKFNVSKSDFNVFGCGDGSYVQCVYIYMVGDGSYFGCGG